MGEGEVEDGAAVSVQSGQTTQKWQRPMSYSRDTIMSLGWLNPQRKKNSGVP